MAATRATASLSKRNISEIKNKAHAAKLLSNLKYMNLLHNPDRIFPAKNE